MRGYHAGIVSSHCRPLRVKVPFGIQLGRLHISCTSLCTSSDQRCTIRTAKISNTEKTLEGNERYRMIYRKTERSCCKNWNPLSWELRVSLRPRSRLFHIHILHDELSELVRTLMRCFLIADEAGENRQVAAFSRCLQSRRTSCLIRMLFINESTWASVEEDYTWAEKRSTNHGDDKALSNCYKVSVQHPLLQKAWKREFTLLYELSRRWQR